MIVLSNSAAQTLQPGQAIVFDTTVLQSGCGECRRNQRNMSAAKMRECGIYALSFNGNIGGVAAGSVQLGIRVDGLTLPETTMISTTAAAGNLNNVSAQTRYGNSRQETSTVTVVNTGTAELTVAANSVLIIERERG